MSLQAKVGARRGKSDHEMREDVVDGMRTMTWLLEEK